MWEAEEFCQFSIFFCDLRRFAKKSRQVGLAVAGYFFPRELVCRITFSKSTNSPLPLPHPPSSEVTGKLKKKCR